MSLVLLLSHVTDEEAKAGEDEAWEDEEAKAYHRVESSKAGIELRPSDPRVCL